MKKKILIITTKNCLGCTVQIKNVQTAIAKSSKHIELEVKDFNDMPKRLIAKYKAYDYPFTGYLLDDELRFGSSGSYALTMVQRYIDVYLK